MILLRAQLWAGKKVNSRCNHHNFFSVSRVLRGELFNKEEVSLIAKFMRMAITEAKRMKLGEVIVILH